MREVETLNRIAVRVHGDEPRVRDVDKAERILQPLPGELTQGGRADV